MTVELEKYRASDAERNRTSDLMSIVEGLSATSGIALDVGARDGHFSRLLTEKYAQVVALDLDKPPFEHDRVTCVQGDVTNLDFEDNHFDMVFCCEVLEHIPTHLLEKACNELSRVAKSHVLIGVPYKQDIRVGQATCYTCGKINPRWAHVNSFDQRRLESLFSNLRINDISFVGTSSGGTNFLSAALMNLAGNPYGSYDQDEPCVHCGNQLVNPPQRRLWQKIVGKMGSYINLVQQPFLHDRASWIHILYDKS